MKKLILFFALMFFFGCRSWQPNKTIHAKTKTNTERIITRKTKELPRDIVVYRPDTIYKDTTIVVKGKVNVLRLKYKNSKLNQAECEAPGGKETEETIKENIKEEKKQTEQTEYVDKKTFFIYGIAFALFITLILFLKK